MKFTKKTSVALGYREQGYVFFVSKMYGRMDRESRKKIEMLCKEIAGAHWRALLRFVTEDITDTRVCMEEGTGRSTLYRYLKLYMERFPIKEIKIN